MPVCAKHSEPSKLQHLVMICGRPFQATSFGSSAASTSAFVTPVAVASLQMPGATVLPLELAPSCTQYIGGMTMATPSTPSSSSTPMLSEPTMPTSANAAIGAQFA